MKSGYIKSINIENIRDFFNKVNELNGYTKEFYPIEKENRLLGYDVYCVSPKNKIHLTITDYYIKAINETSKGTTPMNAYGLELDWRKFMAKQFAGYKEDLMICLSNSRRRDKLVANERYLFEVKEIDKTYDYIENDIKSL